MGVSIRSREITYPQLLLLALVSTVCLAALIASATSTAAFSIYNAAWDGTSDLQESAETVGTESSVILNTTAYERASPNQTVAVVLSPDESYTLREVERMSEFVRAGGTVLIAEDFGPQGNELLRALGVDSRVDGRLLRDERHYYRSPDLPIATNVSESNLTQGVEQLTLNHGTVVDPETTGNATILVQSSEFAYLDRDGNRQLDDDETMSRRPVLVREEVGNGTVLVASDPSMFINAMMDRPGNRGFAENLFASHNRVLLDYSHVSGQPPLALALLVFRKTPLLQTVLGLLGIGVALGWYRVDWDQLSVSRFDPRDRGRSSIQGMDRDALRAYLQDQHPDWDEDRIDRIMTGVLTEQDEEAFNE